MTYNDALMMAMIPFDAAPIKSINVTETNILVPAMKKLAQ